MAARNISAEKRARAGSLIRASTLGSEFKGICNCRGVDRRLGRQQPGFAQVVIR